MQPDYDMQFQGYGTINFSGRERQQTDDQSFTRGNDAKELYFEQWVTMHFTVGIDSTHLGWKQTTQNKKYAIRSTCSYYRVQDPNACPAPSHNAPL